MIGVLMALGLVTVAAVVVGPATRPVEAATGAARSPAAVFPTVEGSNLDGRTMRLPQAFEGSLNLVIVAFKREQQADVDTWMPQALALQQATPGLKVYELPVLGRGYRLLRGFIDGGMRSGISDAAARARTITLYIDKTPFKRSLGIATEDRICTLLVTPSGEVVWRADGPMTEAAAERLRARVSQVSPR